MIQDCKVKRAQYIDKTVDIRNTFSFANPTQILTAIEKYTGDHYGAMLYDLYDDKNFGKYHRCWGTNVKLTWECPRATHRYFVNSVMAPEFISIRTKLLSRYIKFFHSLLKSSSNEVRLIASLAAKNKSSTTGKNLAKISQETGLNAQEASPAEIRQALLCKEAVVPEQDLWRVPYLAKLLQEKHEMEITSLDTGQISQLIDSLCTT